ncbi:hypothetical protein MGAS9429_Spy0659 [Streptococcus pyogenes MGAS9429]|uniref:Uncharacterized protein n=1 Tax=Streptococcus pyogenes serotype M12 (strain MGAS9429) TaxID=370551 RepID=Q1JMG5_STRPC|nr:hypothetical protein MGAS9429_Spy0659 [Streptococcus pyogenes MGAS9429]
MLPYLVTGESKNEFFNKEKPYFTERNGKNGF